MRRLFIVLVLFAGALQVPRAQPQRFTVVEATIPAMRDAMAQGRVTSREIVLQYLTRIATYEDKLNAVITVNPQALAEAYAGAIPGARLITDAPGRSPLAWQGSQLSKVIASVAEEAFAR